MDVSNILVTDDVQNEVFVYRFCAKNLCKKIHSWKALQISIKAENICSMMTDFWGIIWKGRQNVPNPVGHLSGQ